MKAKKVSDKNRLDNKEETQTPFQEVVSSLKNDPELLQTVWHLVKAKEGMTKLQR